MANAGYSSDHKLCHAVTTGIWKHNKGKWETTILKLPLHKDSDDIHQTALKNLLYDYYNAFNNPPKIPNYYLEDSTKGSRNLNKIIYQMNQYRQKHWYWKAII